MPSAPAHQRTSAPAHQRTSAPAHQRTSAPAASADRRGWAAILLVVFFSLGLTSGLSEAQTVSPTTVNLTVNPQEIGQVTFTLTNNTTTAIYTQVERIECTNMVFCGPLLFGTALVTLDTKTKTFVIDYKAGLPGTGKMRVRFTFGTIIREVTINFTIRNHGVSVTPDEAPVSVGPGSSTSQPFVVKNTGGSTATFSLSPTCPVGVTCSLSPSSVTLAANASSTATLSYTMGTVGQTLSVTAVHTTAPSVTDPGSIVVSLTPLAVTPDASPATAPGPGNAGSLVFTVKNTSTKGGMFDLDADCESAPASSCTLSPASLDLAAGASAAVTLHYRAGAPGTGMIRLTASGTGVVEGYRDTGSFVLTVPNALGLEVETLNPGTSIERSLCVGVSAGEGAGVECGDLRLVHPFPTTITANVDRTPTLLYNSQHAAPTPAVAANVWLPTGVTLTGQTLSATLTVDGTVRANTSWGLTGWTGGQARRITVGFDASSLATGVYDYTLEVKLGTTGHQQTKSGKLVVVNRQSSPFGPGWWMAGVEQLFSLSGNRFLWVGGDGSTRLYEPTVTTGTPTTWWAAHPGMPADTLRLTGGEYVRSLPDRTEVHFNTQGRHIATVSRLGARYTTNFSYDTTGRLTQILLPQLSSSVRPSYSIAWSTYSYIVTAPGNRSTTIEKGTGTSRLASFIDPDSQKVSFTYLTSASKVINGRTNKQGTINRYEFTAGGSRMVAVVEDTAGLKIRTGVTPVESRALVMGSSSGTAVVLTDATTEIRSPRGDSIATRIWTDRWGAPTVIRDALGAETRLFREDARFPALVTEVRAPNGFTARAAFSASGAPLRTTEINPYGDGRDAITNYEYGDPLHPLLPTKVTQPEGDFVQLAYNPVGNTLWVRDGRGSASQVNFLYKASTDACSEMPWKVVEPAVGTMAADTTTYGYDERCNLRDRKTPLGVISTTFRSTTGRVDSIFLPIDASRREVQRFSYDAMDRDTMVVRVGPAMGTTVNIEGEIYTGAQTLVVKNRYDKGGNPTAVRADGALRDSTVYDNLGRVVKNFTLDPHNLNPNYLPTLTHYDAAGNPDTLRVGDAPPVTMTYDRLNRLVRKVVPSRSFASELWCFKPGLLSCAGDMAFPLSFPLTDLTIPADTTVFTYDGVTGGMRRATTRYTRIGRDYYPNGALRGDTLFVQGEQTFTHALRNEYDRNGRRTALYSSEAAQPQRFQYNPQSGMPSAIVDIQQNSYPLTWNGRNELTALGLPGGITESYSYDRDGRQVRRRTTKGTQTLFFGDSLVYDQRNKLLSSSEGSYAYSGLGYLMQAILPDFPGLSTEEYLVAPDGYVNVIRQTPDPDREAPDSYVWTYEGDGYRKGGTPSMEDCADTPEKCIRPEIVWSEKGRDMTYADEKDRTRDAAGNEVDVLTWTKKFRFMRGISQSGYVQTHTYTDKTRTISWYGADQKLRFIQRQTTLNFICQQYATNGDCNVPYTPTDLDGEFVEYRYDALGRRVYADTKRISNLVDALHHNCWTNCISPKEYYAWDGDQLIYEKRTTATSGPQNLLGSTIRIQYTHGLSIDQPLSLIRTETGDSVALVPSTLPPYLPHYVVMQRTGTPQLIVPHRNSRGLVHSATDKNGVVCCKNAFFPGDHQTTAMLEGMRMRAGELRGFFWYGSLVAGSSDPSGLMYRRNRYYNPESGQFTQIDPLGIAGGLNVYGYADGDPINFSDPFGLCPPENTYWQDCTDERLREAYALLDSSGRGDVIASLVKSGVKDVSINTGLGERVGGQTTYSGKLGRPQSIELNFSGSTIELATSLTHEVWHAAYGPRRQESRNEESDAYTYAVMAYISMGGRGLSGRYNRALTEMEAGPLRWRWYIEERYPKMRWKR